MAKFVGHRKQGGIQVFEFTFLPEYKGTTYDLGEMIDCTFNVVEFYCRPCASIAMQSDLPPAPSLVARTNVCMIPRNAFAAHALNK
jgi:hypothetical protein